MKSSSTSLLVFVLLALAPLVGFSQVFEDDAVLFDNRNNPDFDPSFEAEYTLRLSQSPLLPEFDGNGNFSFGIGNLGGDQFGFGANGIAEPIALYVVEPGDLVDATFVQNTETLAANFGDINPSSLPLAVGESVFLGYWDGLPGFGGNFGWLELSRSDRSAGSLGDLEILGGATAIGSGIIVGTTTAVPEPTTTMPLGLLAIAGLIHRRR